MIVYESLIRETNQIFFVEAAVEEIAVFAGWCWPPLDLSSIALRRLNASYFSGEFSDKLTEGLELVLEIGVVGE